ncbi:polysaccharide pyruvyl transferase family protein [Megamonas funiformis]|uniref:polysaccharide pyruvyl transferase family protein n=1 Tax=Megamonas funiformis TaxID=437897 RepID=UPI001CD545AC|nr:polysaccharide pyruvyl transferase family protein [Megamonas funiformis]UBS48148.1 polysaccharide pyruvyl transferase family protein [Megamonas funiformis]GLU98388.1 hypothetical protein Mfun01_10330 [Megamonas funiformis]
MQITLFDTAIGTSNVGDEIILKSAEEHIDFLLNKSYVIRFATHLSNFHWFQYLRRNFKIEAANNCDFKFILGTNLLTNNMIRTRYQWYIDIFSKRLYKNSIMYGVGRTDYSGTIDICTKHIYDYILRKDIIHSVRDDESKIFIESLNRKAVNTGCPTLWKLNQEHCFGIPKKRSKKVVISLSGYDDQVNKEKDIAFLKIIKKNYNEIYFWVQTLVDRQYYESLGINLNVKYVYSLHDFSKLLNNGNIDYIGTRLHGGIYALQHKIRSIVLAIDNRARGFKKTNNIVCLERDDIDLLNDMINSDFETKINIPEKEINKWLSQFE